MDEGTIAIWPVRLRGSEADLTVISGLLSGDERERAARFAFPHLRRSYIFGRGALRLLLGAYTRLHPADLSFTYGPYGKPALMGAGRLYFNASHAGDRALFAFGLDVEIGVDIEEIPSIPDLLQIAGGFFCPGEEADLISLPPARQAFAFSLCWTRKEAFIKAKGGGLSIPLHSFRVSLLPDDPVRFLALPSDDAGIAWTLQDLEVAAGYAGAVAYPGTQRRLEIFPEIDAGRLLPQM